MVPKLKLLLSFKLFNAGMWDAKIYAYQNSSFGGSGTNTADEISSKL